MIRKTLFLGADRLYGMGRLSVALILLLALACEEGLEPDTVWPPDSDLDRDTPVITRVSPADSTLAGVGNITVFGANFSATLHENVIAVGGVVTDLVSVTDSSVTVESPTVVGDSVSIMATGLYADSFSELPGYKMIDPLKKMGEFGEFDDLYGMAVDTDENLYVSINPKVVMKVTPSGEKTTFANISPLPKFDAMRFGPDGYLYGVARRSLLYRIPPTGGTEQIFAAVDDKVADLDFDANGNIWTAGKGAILIRVAPDASDSVMATYPTDVEINALSVFDDYIYSFGKYTGDDSTVVQVGLWRHQLNQDGSVGEVELVLDWGAAMGAFPPVVTDMVIAADGDIYVTASAQAPGYIIHPPYNAGTIEEFYSKVLDAPNLSIVWGTGLYMYLNHKPSGDDAKDRAIYRVNMQKPGAPAYGRN